MSSVFAGVIALVWSAFWILTVSETPSTDRKISKNELQYILTSLGFTFEQVQVSFTGSSAHCSTILKLT